MWTLKRGKAHSCSHFVAFLNTALIGRIRTSSGLGEGEKQVCAIIRTNTTILAQLLGLPHSCTTSGQKPPSPPCACRKQHTVPTLPTASAKGRLPNSLSTNTAGTHSPRQKGNHNVAETELQALSYYVKYDCQVSPHHLRRERWTSTIAIILYIRYDRLGFFFLPKN